MNVLLIKKAMSPVIAVSLIGLLLAVGCATDRDSGGATATQRTPSRFRSPDGRSVEIGRSYPADGGMSYKDPHLDKCWVAEGFSFSGYDTLYIAPTLSTASFQPDEARPLEIARSNFPLELQRDLQSSGLFRDVVCDEAQIKPGAHTLRLENTIIQYSKGGGGARYFVGMYGGGQPLLRVQGVMKDGDKKVFTYEGKRSGVSGGSRAFGAFMKDEDIQSEDIRSLCLDLTDFVSAVAGKYSPR